MIERIEDVQHFLKEIPSFKAEGMQSADFSLDRFRAYCKAAGNPHQKFPSIHVAGTNGKGSTCQLIAAMYMKSGLHVGVFISPHIMRYNERFTINGRQISDKQLIKFFQTYIGLIQDFNLTYFEISTAVAFWWFAHQKVHLAVIETGLGGRLDATNVISPLASLITTIGLDHTDILGETIEEIAAEKSGIIKQNIPVVLGNIQSPAKEVILRAAKEKNATLLQSTMLQPGWRHGSYHLTIDARKISLKSTLQTPVQAYNIAAAWMACRSVQNTPPVTEAQCREGIKKVGMIFKHTARFEKLSPRREWYFDGAHNLQAIQAMKQMVCTKQPVEETVLVFSLMIDKINKKMLAELSEFKKMIYYTLPLGRAAAIEDVKARFAKVESFPAKKKDRIRLFEQLKSELVIFGGSFYFYATVRNWLPLYMNDR